MAKKTQRMVMDLALITVGCALYAFGLVTVNIANHLAEGGITGITLLIRFWWHIDPAYSTLILNVPLIIVGYKFLGKRALAYTVYGTVMLSVFLWLWQRLPVSLDIHHDLFIAGVMAGLFGGIGSGLIYRRGGTTGGSDVIARILEKQTGIPMGRSLLGFDVVVLLASLSYLNLERMMYTLLASYVFSRIVDFVLEGAYAAKGVLVVSDAAEPIANQIMSELERGATYLKAEGGFARDQKRVVYAVVATTEIAAVKRIINDIDPQAFITILDVHEALGEGFTYKRKPKRLFFS
ncbi:YitT family protein [Lacticaseibacillus jixianensis]|uniref:YitT family protein n=1 Tax=Lacticaseibacillus jixianensis TaxID=2486012 RepID=A0ABW4B708_9LACO|nr:YitT family protein [Lacticaseibacillus jixianensis]